MKNNLKSLELLSLIIMLIISSYIGIGIHTLIKINSNNSYISIIISLITGIPIILVFLTITNYEKKLPINLKLKKIFGQYLGKIINFILIIGILFNGIVYMYNLISFIEMHFLPNTPLLIIGICFISIVIYANIKGLTTILRLSFILMFINFFLFLIPFIHLLPNANYNNLKPFLATGISNSILGSIKLVLLTINNIFILTIIPKNKFKDNHRIKKYVIYAYIIALIIMFLITIMTIITLGKDLTNFYQYPEYIVLKKINLFNFLNRIENIISIQWINGIFISLCMIIHFISNAIIINNNSKILTSLIGLTILFSNFILFKNNTQFNNFCFNILPIINLVILIIFLLASITIFIKNRNKKLS